MLANTGTNDKLITFSIVSDSLVAKLSVLFGIKIQNPKSK